MSIRDLGDNKRRLKGVLSHEYEFGRSLLFLAKQGSTMVGPVLSCKRPVSLSITHKLSCATSLADLLKLPGQRSLRTAPLSP